MLFRDRAEAGQRLGQKLKAYANRQDVLVLGLPRGGVPVAFEVAMMLNAPLDVLIVRKLGVPGHEELAMGAIASSGVRILNEEIINSLGVSEEAIARTAAQEQLVLECREWAYRGKRPPLSLSDRTVILVDDGLATGATMYAATIAIKQQHPQKIVVAVPVSAPETCNELSVEVDEIICVETPRPFHAVGLWYEKFPQTTDAEVQNLLKRSAERETIAT